MNNALDEARDHLGAILMQRHACDDQIIMDHVRAAHTILQVVTRAAREMADLNSPAMAFEKVGGVAGACSALVSRREPDADARENGVTAGETAHPSTQREALR